MAWAGSRERSTSSSRSTSTISAEEKYIQSFCKQMLKTRPFEGNYQARRFVRDLGCDRDLIVVSNTDKDLKSDLEHIKQRLAKFYENEKPWIGITLPEMIGAPAGVCIWTEVENLAFGEYLFTIKSIRFRENEIIIKVKPQRESNHDDVSNFGENSSFAENFQELLFSWRKSISSSVLYFLNNEVTQENIVASLRFLSVLLLSIFTASVEALKFGSTYLLKLLVELRHWVRTLMPIFMFILDIIQRIIGGIFILLAMIWRDIFSGGRSSPPSYASLMGPPSMGPRPNRYESPYGGTAFRNNRKFK